MVKKLDKAHNLFVILLLLLDFSLSEIFAVELGQEIKVIKFALYLFLILWGTFNLFVCFGYDKGVSRFKVMRLSELVEEPRTAEYIKIFFLLWAGQFSFDTLEIYGLVVFLALTSSYIILSLAVILYDFKKTKTWTTSILGHLILVGCLLIWSKNTYTRINGDEVIGSFFEKSEYRTQYYAILTPETNSSKNYKLKADIWVFNETSQDYEGRSYTYKVIMVEKVYFKNGGYVYFDDCQVDLNKKEYCIDQNSRGWYIQLTNTKVE